jgi:protocadherin alpha
VLTLLLCTALRCSAVPTESMCRPGKPMLVCSSAVGSWSYSQQRRQRVCSGEVPPKTDLMVFSPSLTPCQVADVAMDQSTERDQSGKVGITFSFILFCVVNFNDGRNVSSIFMITLVIQ